jgi:parallel beta-helix repeat protein
MDFVGSSDHNSIRGNTVEGNSRGISLYESSNNSIIYNNFWNNTSQVDTYNSVNSWDDGYPSGGNYWSDYTGEDANGDEIGDTPYTIDANNQDNYPLMGPWTNVGENVTATHASGVSLTFANVTSSGITTVNVTQSGPDPPSGFRLALEPPIFYDIKTTADYTGPIQIRVAYNDTGLTHGQENNLRLMHWNETIQQWTDITKSVDTEDNLIWGETDHLSIFVVMLSPNIATTNITISKTVVGQGYFQTINVSIENQGGYAETFNVTAYANVTVIQTKTITLSSGNSTTITFTWNTTGFAYGNYTISAIADTVLGETDTTDNNSTDGWVTVTILGDVNGDFKCEGKDIAIIAKAYGSLIGQPAYVPNADINNDGKIDGKDIAVAAKYYGTRYP